MKIAGWCAILAIRPGAPGVERLSVALGDRGVRAVGLHPSAVQGPPADEAPDLALCRLVSGCSDTLLEILIAHEHDGLRFLNRPSIVREVHDKSWTLRRLASAGFDVPPTVCITRGESASLDSLDGDVFVVKPATGAAGRGVTMNS